MYSSEFESWSDSWRQTKVRQDEYSCPIGEYKSPIWSTKAPSGEPQRPVGVQMYNCTAVGGYRKMLL
jgi:hypothetical protein